MKTTSSKWLLLLTVVTAALTLSNMPAHAQAYDVSAFTGATATTAASTESTATLGTTTTATATTPASTVTTYTNEPSSMTVDGSGNLTVDPSYVPGQYGSGNTNTPGTVLDITGNTTNPTGTQGNASLPSAYQALLAPGTAVGYSGPGDSPTTYTGVMHTGSTSGGILPSARYAPMDGVVNVAQ